MSFQSYLKMFTSFQNKAERVELQVAKNFDPSAIKLLNFVFLVIFSK